MGATAATKLVAQVAPKAAPPRWPLALGWALALSPAAFLAAQALRGALTADPVAYVLGRLGLSALLLLLASLACTPLQRWAGWSWTLRIRKLLGLAAFFWALAHLLFWAGIDQGLDFSAMAHDVVKRRFVTAGMLAFTLLVPLALTSTKRAPSRLGFRRWKRLHRLVYFAAAAGCVHYLWRFKLVEAAPIAAFVTLALLLAARLRAR